MVTQGAYLECRLLAGSAVMMGLRSGILWLFGETARPQQMHVLALAYAGVLDHRACQSFTNFSGIIESDETYQRDSRKGSREWVRYFADTRNVPQPPCSRWEDFTTQGVKMMRRDVLD